MLPPPDRPPIRDPPPLPRGLVSGTGDDDVMLPCRVASRCIADAFAYIRRWKATWNAVGCTCNALDCVCCAPSVHASRARKLLRYRQTNWVEATEQLWPVHHGRIAKAPEIMIALDCRRAGLSSQPGRSRPFCGKRPNLKPFPFSQRSPTTWLLLANNSLQIIGVRERNFSHAPKDGTDLYSSRPVTITAWWRLEGV